MKTYANLIDYIRPFIRGMEYDAIIPAKGNCYGSELPEKPCKVTAEPGNNESYYVSVEGTTQALCLIRIHYGPAVGQILKGCWNAINNPLPPPQHPGIIGTEAVEIL